MKILFSFDDARLIQRAEILMNACKARGHSVEILGAETKISNFDVWLYDLCSFDRYLEPTLLMDKLESFDGKMVCISFEDGYCFFEHRISNKIIDKTSIFMNNALWRDKTKYDPRLRDKLRLTLSFIDNGRYFNEVELDFDNKIDRVFFYGHVTGQPPEWNCRIKMLKVLKDAGIPFSGGLIGSDPYPELATVMKEEGQEFLVPVMSSTEYAKEMSKSLIALAPRGNAHPTYRLFESLAGGCLTVATPLSEIELFTEPIENIDYVVFQPDSNNLTEICSYFLKNRNEAIKISRSGRNRWERYFKLTNGVPPQETLEILMKNILG